MIRFTKHHLLLIHIIVAIFIYFNVNILLFTKFLGLTSALVTIDN